MTYLTFVNTHTEYAAEAAENLGGFKINGFYDFLIPNTDPAPILKELTPSSSSLTLRTRSDYMHLHKWNVLLLRKPGDSIDADYDTEGVYDGIITTRNQNLDDIITEMGVKGYLEFALDEEVDFEGKDIPLKGKNYVDPRNPRDLPSHEDIVDYIEGCKKLSILLNQEGDSLIYAPARGAHPIAALMLWHSEVPFRTYFPPTSSFVENGRNNNKSEIALLNHRHGRSNLNISYVEEMVSGGMMQGHLREIFSSMGERIASGKGNVHAYGLAHLDGNKLDENLKRRFHKLNEGKILDMETAKNLFTLDDNRFLGIHYLDYSFGPHCVPYPKQDILARAYKELNTPSGNTIINEYAV